MSDSLEQDIDKLVVDSRAVKEAAENINPENPNPVIQDSVITEEITAYDESDSVFTGEEEKVAGPGIIPKIFKPSKKVKEEKPLTEREILNKSVFDKIDPKDGDYIVTPYEPVDVKKILGEAKDQPSSGKPSKIKERGKGKNIPVFNLNTITGPESLNQFINYVGVNSPAKLKKMPIKELATELSTPTFSIIQDGVPISKFKSQADAEAWIKKQPDSNIYDIQQNQLYSEKFLKDILNPNKKTVADPVYVRQMLLAQVDVAAQTDAMAKKIIKAEADGTLNINMQVEFDQMFALMGELSKAIEGRTADVGRTLRMFGEARGATGNLEKLEVLEAQGASVNSIDRARKFLALNTVNEKGKAASMRFGLKTAPNIAIKMWQTTWINGLLSSPVTHAKNMSANLAYGIFQAPVRLMASGIGHVRRGIRPGGETAIPINESWEFAINYFGSAPDSFRLGAKAFRNNAPLDGSKTKLELEGAQNVFENVDYGDTVFGKSMKTGMSYYGKFITLPGRALMAEDEFFKGLARFAEFKALAGRAQNDYVDALIKNGTPIKEAREKGIAYYDDIVKNPPENMIKQAVEFSKEMTFTKNLEGFMATVQKQINNSEAMSFGPILKMFAPFVRTPTNLVTEALKHTPAAFLQPSFIKAIKAGGRQSDLALAKVGLGSLVIGGFANYTMSGNMTGAGPKNRKMKKTLEATGWRPYSLVFDSDKFTEEGLNELRTYGTVTQGQGKIYWSYEGLQPLSTLAGVGASIGEFFMVNSYASSQGYHNQALSEELVMAGIMSGYDILSEMPVMQGLSNLMEVIGSGEDERTILRSIKKMGEISSEFAIQGSPMGAYQSGKATIERYLDPTVNTFLPGEGETPLDTAIKKYKSRLPYYSNEVAPRLDPLSGEKVTVGAGNFYELFSPFKKSTGKYIEGYQTLIDWNVPVYVPPFKKNGYEFSAEQYNTWIEIATNGGQLQSDIMDMGAKFDTSYDVGAVQSKLKSVMSKAYSNAYKELKEIYPEIQDYEDELEIKEEVLGETRY
tara:strand:+ start:5054 stop:8125 length:3072 start_codon:yes stop_codon:yes gene_type:complete